MWREGVTVVGAHEKSNKNDAGFLSLINTIPVMMLCRSTRIHIHSAPDPILDQAQDNFRHLLIQAKSLSVSLAPLGNYTQDSPLCANCSQPKASYLYSQDPKLPELIFPSSSRIPLVNEGRQVQRSKPSCHACRIWQHTLLPIPWEARDRALSMEHRLLH